MSKYITDFQQTGESTINVDLICKDWNERFSISTWINDKEEKYTLIVNSKRKGIRLCKTGISKDQAMQVVARLELVHLKSRTFSSGGIYHSRAFILSEAERVGKILAEKEQELAIIRRILAEYEAALEEDSSRQRRR